ncbi:MAG: alcohol dehydrogenase catalytic domain-containing protein [Myxococcota bacterium]|nr:alcohol dehydrogenase catalytic domain-containing protein [Myxococcota bacterium]
MRAVRCRDGGVELVEVPAPPGDGVRVRIRSAGICGSDLHLISGTEFPIAATLGHELAGVTDDGTSVAVEPIQPCGECEFCLGGDYQRCVRGPTMVMGTVLDGGMADEVRVPERCLVRLPAGLRVDDACLVEPTAVAVHGFVQIGLRGDQRVVIVGGGAIGLAALAVARASGATVDLVARHAAQLEACERLGGGALGESESSGNSAYDIVVDAAGTSSSLARCVELARPGATLLLLASYWEGMELPGFLLCMKEVRIVPSMMYGRRSVGRDIDIAASILASDPAIADVLITHRFPLDDAVLAFETAAARGSGAIKVVLEP